MKEKLNIKYSWVFFAAATFFCSVLLVFVLSVSVNAAEFETETKSEEYIYTFTTEYFNYVPNDKLDSNYMRTVIIKSEQPFKIVSFRYQYETAYGDGRIGQDDKVETYILPESQTNRGYTIDISYDGGETWETVNCDTSVNANGTKLYYFRGHGIYLLSDSDNGYYSTAATTLPYMNVSGQEQINKVLEKIAVDDWTAYQETENVPLTYEFDVDIETPVLVFTEGKKFYINNASDDYGIEIQGRWWSVDDIELYKENLSWKYKYSTLIKNELSYWVTPDMKISSVGEHDLISYGQVSFDSLIAANPVENRNYYGGTNAVGNYFSGFSDAKNTLEMLLKTAGTLYTSPEIYIRFWYEKDGVVHHGRWCHWYESLANPFGSSGSQWDDKDNMFTENQSDVGLTPDEMEEIENTGDSITNDSDAMPDYNNVSSWESVASDKFVDNVFIVMQSMVDALGDFPRMVQQVFLFLPEWVITFIGVGLAFIVVLRFLGR